ncbi:hypothetical protein ACFL6S_07770 [Candidatus Poribacteria bacterium]
MCGIIYYKSFTGKTVNRQVLKHYLKQKGRGYKGFGFVSISRKRILTCRATKENGIRFYLKRYPLAEILFHHRLPTSTTNTIRTTHPIAISQPVYRHKYYLIHNGIIQNASELKVKHEVMGIDYVTPQWSEYSNFWGSAEERYEFNDSEALAHEVALFLDGKHDKIETQGDVAFICLETDRNGHALRLHFARNNGAPLEMKRTHECMVIASENVSEQDIPPHKLYTYDYRTQCIDQREIELPEYELLSSFTFHPHDIQWDPFNEMELEIQECESKLQQIEQTQFRASARGDIVKYQRLQRKKEQLEKRIQDLYEEWYSLERGIW